MNDHYGIWVYAITDRGDGEDLAGPAGVAGAAVRAAAAGGLTALVSHVDLAEFGEEAMRRNLEDLDWLEQVARAHHAVVDAAARRFPVLPARFATVYSDEVALSGVLAGQGGELRAALRRVGECVEWGVKAYPARTAAPATGASTDPARSGAGTAYLRRRRAELSAREDSRRSAAAAARAVHEELARHAAQSRLYPPQSPALRGNRTPMLLNAAYLLGKDRADGFGPVLAATAGAHPELRLELSGPWPPYSFTAQVS